MNIVNLVESFGIELKKNNGKYKGLCPFHNEKTPSFYVNENKGLWHCFGCGEGGDSISFVRKLKGCDFPTAKKIVEGMGDINADRTVTFKKVELFAHNPKDIIDEEKTLNAFIIKCISLGMLNILKDYKIFNYTGRVAFPHITFNDEIRGVKLISYLSDMHRDKQKLISWLHSEKKLLQEDSNIKFQDCFFGEHLIFKKKYDFVGVVESEKTAIFATKIFGGLFLATGSKSNINKLKYKGLESTRVILFPDGDGYEAWDNFVQEEKNENWKLSTVKMVGKEDICDVILSNQEDIIDKIKKEIALFCENDIVTENSVTNCEKTYYDSIFRKKMSKKTAKMIFLENNITSVLNFEYDKYSNLIISENGEKKTLQQIFYENDKKNDFENLCLKYHIPLFPEASLFDFNGTREYYIQLITEESPLFFRGLVFNILPSKFEPSFPIAEFDLFNHILQCVENLFLSTLNEQGRSSASFFKLKNEIQTLCNGIENKKLSEITTEKIISKYYLDILDVGKAFLQEKIKAYDDTFGAEELFFFDFFKHIWNISDDHIFSFISFCVSSIRRKFKDDIAFAKLLQITGDGGVGKDTAFISLLLGDFAPESKYFSQEKIEINNFSSLGERKMRSLIYAVISDDIAAANEMNKLAKISNFYLTVNAKYGSISQIKNNFNRIVSNNNPRIIFDKEINEDAVSRRFIFVNVKYLDGNNSTDYLNFFKKNEEKLKKYYAAFFYYCWKIAENSDMAKEMANKATNISLKELSENIYLTNEDEIVIDNMIAILKKNTEDIYRFEKNGISFLGFKSDIFFRFSPRKEMSTKAIKKVISLKFSNFKQNVPIRLNGATIKLNIIPAHDILPDAIKKTDEEPKVTEERTPKKTITLI